MVSKKGNPGTSASDNLHLDHLTCVQRYTRVLKMLKQAIKHYLKKFSSGGEMWNRVFHHSSHER